MTGNVYNMTVCRSPVYAHHDPAPIEEGLTYRYMDQGEQIFSYIISFDESCSNHRAVRLSDLLNIGYEYLVDTYHEGIIKKQSMSLASLDKANIIIKAFKNAEDNSGYIFRLYETDGIETETELCIKQIHKKYTLRFEPCEIKTVLITKEAEDYVCKEINMLEV
jgi:alpha-mannosidase